MQPGIFRADGVEYYNTMSNASFPRQSPVLLTSDASSSMGM